MSGRERLRVVIATAYDGQCQCCDRPAAYRIEAEGHPSVWVTKLCKSDMWRLGTLIEAINRESNPKEIA